MHGEVTCAVRSCSTPLDHERSSCRPVPPPAGQCCPDAYDCGEWCRRSRQLPTDLVYLQLEVQQPNTTLGGVREREVGRQSRENETLLLSPFTVRDGDFIRECHLVCAVWRKYAATYLFCRLACLRLSLSLSLSHTHISFLQIVCRKKSHLSLYMSL